MGHQGNNVYFSDDFENAIVTCTCGSLEHGTVAFISNLPDDEFDYLFFIEYSGLPYTKNFWQKLCRAWDLILGRPLQSDMYSSIGEAKKIGEFLIKRAELAEEYLERLKNNKGTKMTLGELRKLVNESSIDKTEGG